MVSYFEQVQNNSNFYWDLEEVDSRLYKKITNATNDVWNISKQKNENIQEESKKDMQKQDEVKEVKNSLEKFTQNIKKYLLNSKKVVK